MCPKKEQGNNLDFIFLLWFIQVFNTLFAFINSGAEKAGL